MEKLEIITTFIRGVFVQLAKLLGKDRRDV